jgi:hypothetical protein
VATFGMVVIKFIDQKAAKLGDYKYLLMQDPKLYQQQN